MAQPNDICREVIEAILPSLEVIEANDDDPSAPRPNVDSAVSTYVAYEIVEDDSSYSTAQERTTDTRGTVDLTKVRQHRSLVLNGQLNVEVYGPGAMGYARDLRRDMGRPDILLLLAAAGDYSIDTPSAVSDDPIIRSITREPGATVSFQIKWVDSEVFEAEGVDTISTTTTVTADGE